MVRLRTGLALAVVMLGISEMAAQDVEGVCLPPAEPHVPQTDADFVAYADIVAHDFERYFAALTDYFACMDRTRQAVFRRAEELSRQHQAFHARAYALGIGEKIAVTADPSVSGAGP